MLVKYNNSILNLANSIREYYGLDTYYDTDKDVSEWLNTNKFKHLFILLLIIYHKIYIEIVIKYKIICCSKNKLFFRGMFGFNVIIE